MCAATATREPIEYVRKDSTVTISTKVEWVEEGGNYIFTSTSTPAGSSRCIRESIV